MALRRPPSLRAQAVAWLAQREYSVSEMRRKLHRRLQAMAAASGADGGGSAADEASADAIDAVAPDDGREVDAVIEWLLQNRYLDEDRFVDSRVRVRSAGHGLARIAQELSRHGIDLPTDTAQALRESEPERAWAIWQRRFGEPPADQRAAARQARFLAGRGFSAEVVARILRAVRRPGHREDEPG